MAKVLEKTNQFARRDGPAPPQWPSYQGVSQFVGTSPSGRVTVYVDPSLGPEGLQNARDLVADADRVVNQNDAIFGTTGGPVSVIVFALGGSTDGTGGADHMGCDYETGGAIEVCASFGNSARVSALFEAELSECSMGGNVCGASTGEALSRWCAAATSNNALGDFTTAPTWASDGMPDYVNTTDPTDQNPDSTGCGMAFISWLISLGYGLDKIAPAMVALGDGGTFAQIYAQLTGDSEANAWPKFQDAVQALPGGVTSDDPFGATSGSGGQAQAAQVTSSSIAVAAEILSAIVTDMNAGKPAAQIVADVNKLLSKAGQHGRHAAGPASCSTRSRRLRLPRKH
jgi:hypothetical protein